MSALGEPTDVLELRVSGIVLVYRENKNTDKSMKWARKRAKIIKIRGAKKLASARHKYANVYAFFMGLINNNHIFCYISNFVTAITRRTLPSTVLKMAGDERG